MRILVAVVGAAAFASIGLLGLLWPRELQRYILRRQRQISWNPFLPLMRTEAYVTMLRLIGLLALAAAVVIIAVLIFGEP